MQRQDQKRKEPKPGAPCPGSSALFSAGRCQAIPSTQSEKIVLAMPKKKTF